MAQKDTADAAIAITAPSIPDTAITGKALPGSWQKESVSFRANIRK